MADSLNFVQFYLVLSLWSLSLGIRYPYECIRDVTDEYTLPELPYGYDDLEPYIDDSTVKVHHTGHHAAYTKKMNLALQKWRSDPTDDASLKSPARKSILDILADINSIPDRYRTAIINNGGGFVNHNLYWSVMSPNPYQSERYPGKDLLSDIIRDFGNYSNFVDLFTKEALNLFGSGYVWLSRKPLDGGKLLITTTTNQDSPVSQNLRPILVLDVWEHAYYLKHQNRRPNHISDWWKLVDWDAVEKLDSWWTKNIAHDEF